ncbi:MAG TPA: transcriptional regulator, partial [Eubacteriaceae bacterium]|nr:transcriptional regulator [Eubacteriaceae bacterium]
HYTDFIDLIESNEYGYCSLIKAINRVLDKLDVYNTTHTRITGKPRRDQWRDVDNNALREAVVNAVVHNDYATNEVPPVFEIFSDRLVITSMGGLPISMTKDEFFKGISKPRNKVLMRVFKDMDLVEQLGSGMDRILSIYDRSIFEISDNYVRVSFKYNVRAAINGDKTAIKLDQKEAVIKYAEENVEFKAKEIQVLLNLKPTRTRDILASLCEENILEKHGIKKGTYYTKK